MRHGFLLIELLIAMVVMAILAAITVPRLQSISDAVAVRDESYRLVAAIDATRGAGTRLGTTAWLDLSDTAYRVLTVVAGDTVVCWRRPGPSSQGVTVTGAGASIRFGPAGLAVGASNRTLTLVRGAATRRVVMSRLGRVTW